MGTYEDTVGADPEVKIQKGWPGHLPAVDIIYFTEIEKGSHGPLGQPLSLCIHG